MEDLSPEFFWSARFLKSMSRGTAVTTIRRLYESAEAIPWRGQDAGAVTDTTIDLDLHREWRRRKPPSCVGF